jgi:hypothetical protein
MLLVACYVLSIILHSVSCDELCRHVCFSSRYNCKQITTRKSKDSYVILSHCMHFCSTDLLVLLQGGSNMTVTNCDLFTHNQSRSYLNHLVLILFCLIFLTNVVPKYKCDYCCHICKCRYNSTLCLGILLVH